MASKVGMYKHKKVKKGKNTCFNQKYNNQSTATQTNNNKFISVRLAFEIYLTCIVIVMPLRQLCRGFMFLVGVMFLSKFNHSVQGNNVHASRH
jgi:hypothetical protein